MRVKSTMQSVVGMQEHEAKTNWFTESLVTKEPFLVVPRRFVIDTTKLKGYVKSKEFAHANRICGFCGIQLDDRRRIFCNSRCRRNFNRKFRFFTITWRQIRFRAFRRDSWTCVKCGRRAREVDHIIPLSEGGNEFDLNNCQSLCRTCHLQKTISEMRKRRDRKINSQLSYPIVS
jgi:hypothetical protein